jgi:hypothetical protein
MKYYDPVILCLYNGSKACADLEQGVGALDNFAPYSPVTIDPSGFGARSCF